MSIISSATSGMQAAQWAMQVASENVAGASVEGYHRKEIMTAREQGGQVLIIGARQHIDDVLESNLRTTETDSGYFSVQNRYAERWESALTSAANQLNGITSEWTSALQTLQTTPNSSALRRNLLETAERFVDRSHRLGDFIEGQTRAVDEEMGSAVRQVNIALQDITRLNAAISKNVQLGQPADALEDQRGEAVKALAQWMPVTVNPQGETWDITDSRGNPLVIDTSAAEFERSGSTIRAQFLQGDFEVGIDGGRLGALLDIRNEALPTLSQNTKQAVQHFAEQTNTQLSQGVDFNGQAGKALFELDPVDPLDTIKITSNYTTDDLALRSSDTVGIGNTDNLSELINLSQSFLDIDAEYVDNVILMARQARVDEENANQLLNRAVSARESLSGVNLDEEAANMTRFVELYQANAEVINMQREMFQSLMAMLR